MNLVIDSGNTFTKIAVFHSSEPEYIQTVKELDLDCLASIIAKYPVDACIYSSVTAGIEPSVSDYLKRNISSFLFFDNNTRLPVQLNYRTPQTLGRDRIAGVVGAMCGEIGSRNVLVIDAGTAITYDLLVDGIRFDGGNISPGVGLRLRSLNQFTGRLPLVSAEGDLPQIGYDTETAIRAGVVWGIVYEIEGYIRTLKINYSDLLIFLTGGDANLFAEKLKSPIFVDRKLVLKGLNRILKYNVEK